MLIHVTDTIHPLVLAKCPTPDISSLHQLGKFQKPPVSKPFPKLKATLPPNHDSGEGRHYNISKIY